MTQQEFETIQQVLTASERGRGFLDEFARRQRGAEAERMLKALDRMESCAAQLESERARQRRDCERSAQTAAELAELVQQLRAMNEARRAAPSQDTRPPPPKPTPLEKRFHALVDLDSQEFENHFKMFG